MRKIYFVQYIINASKKKKDFGSKVKFLIDKKLWTYD